MPKSRLTNKKHRKRTENRVRDQQKFEVATQVRVLAERLNSQADLRTFLMQQEDPEKRLRMFQYVKPFLKFPNPEFPSILDSPGIILPRGR